MPQLHVLLDPPQFEWESLPRLERSIRKRYESRSLYEDTFVVTYSADVRDLRRVLAEVPERSLVIYHVLGNPLDQIGKLRDLEETLRKFRFRFALGSSSSYRFTQKLLRDPQDCFYDPLAPDPVFIPLRKSSEVFVFAYWGRISWEKNVHHLVKLFSQFARRRSGVELRIAGPIDSIHLRQEPKGFYLNSAGEFFYQAIEEAMASGVKVTYAGNLRGRSLSDFIGSADVFTSLSTSRDEDFGMSVHEALCAGKTCILSRWGGYREFSGLPGVRSVDLHRSGRSFTLSPEELFRSWEKTPEPAMSVRRGVLGFLEARGQRPVREFSTSRFNGFSPALEKSISELRDSEFGNLESVDVSSYWS